MPFSNRRQGRGKTKSKMGDLEIDLMNAAAENQTIKELNGGSLMVFKDRNGDFRWVLFSSNAFQDQDREIVSSKALANDVDRSEKETPGEYGPLRWWHVPEYDMGKCDFRMVSNSGKTLIESGTFKNARIGQAVQKAAKELQVSIGFNHPKDEPDRDGVYHNIYTFERSLLPKGKAANQFTKVFVKGVKSMATKEEKLKALEALGIDPAEILNQAATAEKELENAGTKFKEETPDPVDPPANPLDEALTRAEALVAEIKAKKTAPAKEPEKPADEPDGDESDEEEYLEGDEDGDETPVMGNMSVDEFKACLKEVMGDALAPVTKALEDQRKERESKAAAKKEADDQDVAAMKARLAELEKALKELSGEMPNIARGHVASTDPSTVVSDEAVKELGVPTPDPFVSQFVGNFLNLK